MTFGNARDILRNDILAESSTEYFDDAELLDFVQRSAEEIAAALEFPRSTQTTTVNTAAVQGTFTSTQGVISLSEVTVGEFRLSPAPYSKVIEYRNNTLTIPRFYNFDRRRQNSMNTSQDIVVDFAPASPSSATMAAEVVEVYTAGTAGAQIWNGDYAQFHELVTLRAGEKAFRASLEFDLATKYFEQYQRQYQEFASFLGGVDIGTRTTEGQAAS